MYAAFLEPVSANFSGVTINSTCYPINNNATLLKLVRTEENTYTTYFIEGNTGNLITDLPPINITFTIDGVSYNVTAVNGIATFKLDNISSLGSIKASFGYMNNSVLQDIPISNLGSINPNSGGGSGSGTGTITSGSSGGSSSSVNPKIISISPKSGATSISRTSTISVKFSEKIKSSTNWSKIYVKNLKTGKKVSISKLIKENTLYIKMVCKRCTYNWYQVYIPASAVKNSAGNNLTKSYTWKFKTGRY